MTKRFVKSADTQSPVSYSQREIERILRRYGATDFSFGSSWAEHLARIAFRVPDIPGSKLTVPVRLEVSMDSVAGALGFLANSWGGSREPTVKEMEQAERVAWRHLVLWVDAACSAASAGLQTMSEAFLAHTLVRTPEGDVMKVSQMLDHAAKLQGAEGGYRGMLPAGTPAP